MMQLGKYPKDDEDQKRKTSKGGVEFKKKTKERARKEIIKETERDKNGEQKYKKKEGNKNLRRPEQGQRRTHKNNKKEDMRNIQPNNNKMKKGRANGTEEEGEGEHQTIGSRLNEQERGKLKGL